MAVAGSLCPDNLGSKVHRGLFVLLGSNLASLLFTLQLGQLWELEFTLPALAMTPRNHTSWVGVQIPYDFEEVEGDSNTTSFDITCVLSFGAIYSSCHQENKMADERDFSKLFFFFFN